MSKPICTEPSIQIRSSGKGQRPACAIQFPPVTLKRPTPCQRSKTAHKPKRAAGGQATEGRTVNYRRETEQPAANVVAHFLKTEVSTWSEVTHRSLVIVQTRDYPASQAQILPR